MSSSLVTRSPWRVTSANRTSNARWPSVTGMPWRQVRGVRAPSETVQIRKFRSLPQAPMGRPRFRETATSTIAALPALVLHPAHKAANEINAEDCQFWRHRKEAAGGGEGTWVGSKAPAIVLDASGQCPGRAFDLDRDLQAYRPWRSHA